MQTRVMAALHAVKPGNAADYVKTITSARSEREALFFVDSVEMLQAWHRTSPIKALLTDSRLLVAVTTSGEAVAILPVDWLRDTASARETLRDVATRARAELGATALRLHTAATVSERAQAMLAAEGWLR